MPENYKPIWEQLNEYDKNVIMAQSKFYTLSTPYQIRNFWQTRSKLNEMVELEKLNESVDVNTNISKKTSYSNDYMNRIAVGLKRFNG